MKKLMFALLFIGGISAAMSDGKFFPWPNIVGILLLGIFAYAANKMKLED